MGRMFDQLQKKAIAQVSDSGKKNDLGELHNSELLNVEKSPSTRGHSRCGYKNTYPPEYRTATDQCLRRNKGGVLLPG